MGEVIGFTSNGSVICDSLRSSTGWVNQPFHRSGCYKVFLLYPVPLSWNFREPHLSVFHQIGWNWWSGSTFMEEGGRKRYRQDGMDDVIFLSLPSLRKQAEKPHQWDLKLDTPVNILGFIFQCFVVYAMMLVITLAKKTQPQTPLVLSWSNLSFLFNMCGWHMLALQKAV